MDTMLELTYLLSLSWAVSWTIVIGHAGIQHVERVRVPKMNE